MGPIRSMPRRYLLPVIVLSALALALGTAAAVRAGTSATAAPSVTASSISNGAVFSPAPANLTEVVTFSEPMNTSFTTAASFDLHGNYRGADYAPASFSWSPDGTQLTLNYSKLPDDTYTLTDEGKTLILTSGNETMRFHNTTAP